MEIDVKEIVKLFGLELKSFSKVRSVYKCETDKGTKNLKEECCLKDKILLEYYLKKHLYDNGFFNLDMNLISPETNLPYVMYNNKCYIMTEWIEGRECDLENDSEMEMAVKVLAKMHECSKGFELPPNITARSDMGKMPFLYEKRKKELERIRSRIRKENSKAEFEKCYFASADLFIKEAELAIDVLNNSKYYEIVKHTEEEKSFCHHDYAFHNIIIDKNEKLNIIDFEYSTYEIRFYDIANVIKRSMRKCNWNIDKTIVMLEYYDSVNKLSCDELEVLFAMLIFPQKLWRIMNRYYNGKKNLTFDSNVQKLICEINLYPYHQKYIEDYKKKVLCK